MIFWGLLFAAALPADAAIELGETVDWDLTLKNPRFVYYDTQFTSAAIDHMQAFKTSSGWKVTRRTDRCYNNPEWLQKTERPFFLYPLFGGVECEKWDIGACTDWYKAKRGVNNPYFPLPHTGPEIEFFSPRLPTSMPDFLKLVDGDHWIYLPPGSEKISIEATPVSEVHPDFDFPNGTILVHRLFLNDQQKTPLEWRYIRKVANQWVFGVYEVEGDVDPAHPQYRLSLRRTPSGTMKRVLRHQNRAYGDVQFEFPVASAQIFFEKEKIFDGRVRTVSTNTCIKCHVDGNTLSGRSDLRLALLKDMQAKIQHDKRPTRMAEYMQSLLEEQRRLSGPKQKSKKPTKDVPGCAPLRTYSAEELSPLVQQHNVEVYKSSRAKELEAYAAWGSAKTAIWNTLTYLRSPFNKLVRESSKPCGFSPPHPDTMDFKTDLDGFKLRYQKKFNTSAVEALNWKACAADQVKIGDIISVDDGQIWDQLAVKHISFRVEEIDGAHVVAVALDQLHFAGLTLMLDRGRRGDTRYQLVFPSRAQTEGTSVARDPYFELTDAGILGLPHTPPSGITKSILCRGSDANPNTAVHVTLGNTQTMDDPRERVAGKSFVNGMWIQNLMATRVFDPLKGSMVSAPSHGMLNFGHTFLNGWAIRGQTMGTLDQELQGSYLNPLSAGEWDRSYQLYRNSVHRHPRVLGAEAQVGKRWGSENQNSFFVSTGPAGEGPVGLPYEPMTPAGQFQRPADDHHATRVFHTIRSPITGTLQLGAPGQARWFVQAGVYKVANPIPSDPRLGFPKPDSFGFRIERTLPSHNGTLTQKFGVSAAWQNSIHELPDQDGDHAKAKPGSESDVHAKDKSDKGVRETYTMAYHELQRAFSETARLAMMNIIAHQRKADSGTSLLTYSNQTNARFGAGSKNVLFGGFRVRQLSAEEWEIEPYSIDPTKPTPKSMMARSFNVGVGRQIAKSHGAEVFATVEYQGSWVPQTLLDAKAAGWPSRVAHSPGARRVDQVTFNVWLYLRRGHKH